MSHPQGKCNRTLSSYTPKKRPQMLIKHGFKCLPARNKQPIDRHKGSDYDSLKFSAKQWKAAQQFVMKTGAESNITVVDVDGDYEWFAAFSKKYKFPDTARVDTPSGGFHLYFQYDERIQDMTKGWANGSKFGQEHEIDIDIRSGGIIVGPGSLY